MRDFRLVLVLLLVAALSSPAAASYSGTKAPAEIMPSPPAVELPDWWEREFTHERQSRLEWWERELGYKLESRPAWWGREFSFSAGTEREQIIARALIYEISTKSGPSMADDPEGWLHRAQTSADLEEALHWYRKAAESGLPEAQAGLAALHLSGAKARRNPVRAQMWLILADGVIARDRARENLQFFVQWLRNHIAERLSPEQLAEAERLARDWTPTGN